MVVIGLILLAAAVAAVVVLIAQNQNAMVDVHALGYTWNFHLYWALVGGVAIALIGIAGLAMMRAGAVHSTQVRRERHGLARENARLNERAERLDREPARPVVAEQPRPVVSDSTESDAAANAYTADPAYQPRDSHRHLLRRTRHV